MLTRKELANKIDCLIDYIDYLKGLGLEYNDELVELEKLENELLILDETRKGILCGNS